MRLLLRKSRTYAGSPSTRLIAKAISLPLAMLKGSTATTPQSESISMRMPPHMAGRGAAAAKGERRFVTLESTPPRYDARAATVAAHVPRGALGLRTTRCVVRSVASTDVTPRRLGARVADAQPEPCSDHQRDECTEQQEELTHRC